VSCARCATTGNDWKIHPMRDLLMVSDYIEQIAFDLVYTWICDELYNWFLDQNMMILKLDPHQYEFARLNLNYTVREQA
jgi:glutaminyl-tRNA synthetase